MSGPGFPFGLVVHATHEAGIKIGGIGAVLDGLLGARAYAERVPRTILVGPMSTDSIGEMERLTAPENQLDIRYSSHHGTDSVEPGLSATLRDIERNYGVRVLYGTRIFGEHPHEVILVDGTRAFPHPVNALKAELYRHFGLQSDRYEDIPEYALHINVAESAFLALQAVAGDAVGQRCIVAHEFMGLPLCYVAGIRDPGAYHTVFYGHEVATVRPIIESHPGHDTMFYNVLQRALTRGQYLEDVFGDQSTYFKHALIRPAAAYCDNIFAVGDWVVSEMRFLGPDWERANIDLVYNGVPSQRISLEGKLTSRARLQRYCDNLLGYRPDYVFTHVTRFVPSKGLWRDIRVMERLDPLLDKLGRRAVLYVLSSVLPVGRPTKAVREMEARYGWPVHHRNTPIEIDGQHVPDLLSHEVPFYHAIERFNQAASASKIVLVNQFGWSRDRCGTRMPRDMSFFDIRFGTDLEFGQSIYEPFGIAQLEPLGAGAICVLSSICGCLGFVQRSGGRDLPNIIVADYTELDGKGLADMKGSNEIAALRAMDRSCRDRIEARQASVIARQIARSLPRNSATMQAYLESGYALSQLMSWETVTRDYLLPGLCHAARSTTPQHAGGRRC